MYYRYSVLSPTGNEISASEEGSLENIKKRLSEKSFYILSLEPDIFRSLKAYFTRRKVKPQSLSVFFHDLANMLKTGISINEAVLALEKSSFEPLLARSLLRVNDDLNNGFSLGQAFERTKVFPWQVASVLKVSEKSGGLEQALEGLSVYYSREAEFLRGLRNAVIYPLAVFLMLAGIMFYVSFKVIPHLEALLPSGKNAYLATRLLLLISRFLKDYWLVCLAAPAAGMFFYSRLKSVKTGRFSGFCYRLPVAGELARDAAFSSFFSNLAVLQRNGISIINSLSLIEETIHYRFLSGKIGEIKGYISAGLSFWLALSKDPFFPKLVYLTVRKGEEIGSLDGYLEGLAKYYFDRVTRRIGVILSFIQPLLLVICAGILLFIVSAFIIPVYSNLSVIAGGNVKF